MSSVSPETTPLLLVTNAGLAAASVAKPEGPYIHIVGFQIGSGYGYTPTANQTAIQGNLLYSATPTSYQSIGNNTLDILCEIPPTAGPFQFGEVALFLGDANDEYSASSPLFAIAVFDTPQTKFSSLGTNVISSYALNCLLKLQQSTAVFQINTTEQVAVYNIFQWSDVYPPEVSANPNVPIYLVKELDEYGDSTILQNSTLTEWSVGSSYSRYNSGLSGITAQGGYLVANSSTSWVEVASSHLHTQDLTSVNRRYLVQTPDGFFRSVSSVVVSGSNYRFNLNVTNDGTYNNSPLINAPEIGSTIIIYRDDQRGGSIYYEQIIDPPSIPLASPGTPGLAYGGTGTYMPGGGAIQAYGILQSPSTNTGRELTGGDNLNSTNWASGLYICYGGVGYPANMPVNIDGHIWMHAENPLAYTQGGNANSITQIFYPSGGGGGDSVGNNGYPPYWREWNATVSNSQGGWSNWFPFSIVGKIGNGSLFAANGYQKFPGGMILQWGTIPGTQGFNTVTFPIVFPNACLRVMNSVLLFGPGNVANNNYSGVVSFNNSSSYLGTDQNGTGWIAIGY
jgi:hypothetical protein